MANIILFLNMLSYSQGDYSLVINISEHVPNENVLILDVTVSNKTNKKIYLDKYETGYINNYCFRR